LRPTTLMCKEPLAPLRRGSFSIAAGAPNSYRVECPSTTASVPRPQGSLTRRWFDRSQNQGGSAIAIGKAAGHPSGRSPHHCPKRSSKVLPAGAIAAGPCQEAPMPRSLERLKAFHQINIAVAQPKLIAGCRGLKRLHSHSLNVRKFAAAASFCCVIGGSAAGASTGHATAAPHRSVMNWRRMIVRGPRQPLQEARAKA
jgi:hypothetical protein